MINHVRSLILNELDSKAGSSSGLNGAVYIPDNFKPVNLPEQLKSVRRVILPDDYTPYQANYVMACIMRLLHAPDLEPYTLLLDSRYTYSLSDDFTAQLRESAVDVGKWYADDCLIDVTHNHYAARRWTRGSAVIKWTINRVDNNHINLILGKGAPQIIRLDFKQGKSQTIKLLPDYLHIIITSPAESLDKDFRFDIDYYPIPEPHLNTILSDLIALEGRSAVLNLMFTPWEPYIDTLTALYKLWRYSVETHIRVGAVLLAYAFKVEQLRRGVPLVNSSAAA